MTYVLIRPNVIGKLIVHADRFFNIKGNVVRRCSRFTGSVGRNDRQPVWS